MSCNYRLQITCCSGQSTQSLSLNPESTTWLDHQSLSRVTLTELVHWVGHVTHHVTPRSITGARKHSCAGSHLSPGMSCDLREAELCVVGVHLLDLLSAGGPQNLHKTINSIQTAKYTTI